MNRLYLLIKREYWENRGSFFKAPVVFGGLILLIAISYLILLCTHHTHFSFNGNINADSYIPHYFTAGLFYIMSFPFMIVLWLVAFYYFLNCLYDDRKDRSILFWQSLPIAEWETVTSKALAGLILAPLCSWFCIIVTEFIFLIVVTIAAASLGVNGISALWSPTVIIMAWLHILGALLLQGLWLFPLFAWCLLCSAYAKKSPFLTAILPYFLIIIIEGVFFRSFIVGGYVTSRFDFARETWNQLFAPLQSFNNVAQSRFIDLDHFSNHHFTSISLYWSIAIGVAFMAIAAYLRYSCYRSDEG